MKTIINLEQSIYQIKNLLLNDEIIRKLLYIQTPSALSSTATITNSMASDLVSILPYVEDADGIANSAASNFIVIYPRDMVFNDMNSNLISISIDIFVYKDYYLLDGNKLRLTQLLNRVVDILENTKISFAEKITITNSRLSSIDNGKTIGFLTLWEAADGTSVEY